MNAASYFLYEVSKVIKLREKESKMVVGAWGKGVGKQWVESLSHAILKRYRDLLYNKVYIVNKTTMYL